MELTGKLLKGLDGLYTVKAGNGLLTCKCGGAIRHRGEKPLIGDDVTVTGEGSDYLITEILPRRNSLIRPPLANVDTLFLVLAVTKPEPSLITSDKLISIAEYNHIEPAVIITKDDLDESKAAELASVYRKSGFDVFVTSSVRPDAENDTLREFILSRMKDKTSAFAGASGVGKSTLLNALFPSLSLASGEISRKIERGKHTTRHVELFPLAEVTGEPGHSGFLADTPGFGMLDLIRFDFFTLDELPLTFREFVPLLTECRYTKCTHTKEEGCAVLQAVREGRIAPSRHESFLEMYADLKAKKKW